MPELPHAKAFGHTIFCEDVRYEKSNKVSYMGVYNGLMVLPVSLPTILPRLSLGITYCEKVGAYKGEVSLLIYFPGDDEDHPTLNEPIPFAQSRNAFNAPPEDPDFERTDPGYRIDFQIIFQPCPIKKRGPIKVKATVDGDIIKLGTLAVVCANDGYRDSRQVKIK